MALHTLPLPCLSCISQISSSNVVVEDVVTISTSQPLVWTTAIHPQRADAAYTDAVAALVPTSASASASTAAAGTSAAVDAAMHGPLEATAVTAAEAIPAIGAALFDRLKDVWTTDPAMYAHVGLLCLQLPVRAAVPVPPLPHSGCVCLPPSPTALCCCSDEFGFVSSPPGETAVDELIIHMRDEHKLGIAYAAAAPLYLQAQARHHAVCSAVRSFSEQDSAGLAAHRARRCGASTTAPHACVYCGVAPAALEALDCSSRTMLLINAECYTAWNTRCWLCGAVWRRVALCVAVGCAACATSAAVRLFCVCARRKWLLLLGHASFASEVALVNVVQSKHRKSGESWAHRKWLRGVAERACAVPQRSLAALDPAAFTLSAQEVGMAWHEFVRREFAHCDAVAGAYPRNYYAWTHRSACLPNCDASLLFEELAAMEHWLRTHHSDFSAMHHRGNVLQAVFVLAQARVPAVGAAAVLKCITSMLQLELRLSAHLLAQFGSHEALWCFRRMLLLLFKRYLPTTPADATVSDSAALAEVFVASRAAVFADAAPMPASTVYAQWLGEAAVEVWPFSVPTWRHLTADELAYSTACVAFAPRVCPPCHCVYDRAFPVLYVWCRFVEASFGDMTLSTDEELRRVAAANKFVAWLRCHCPL